eukprot:2288248-Lingulodinium_polyedra.AAC.1
MPPAGEYAPPRSHARGATRPMPYTPGVDVRAALRAGAVAGECPATPPASGAVVASPNGIAEAVAIDYDDQSPGR